MSQTDNVVWQDPIAVELQSVDVFRILDQVHVVGCLAHHPFGLRVSFTSDVDDLVALAGQVRDELVGAHDVGARRVHRRQAKLHRAPLDLGRNAVRGEDHGAFFDLLQPGEPVGLVDERDPLALQVVGGMGVVDQHAEHVDRAVGLLANPLGDAERIHHPVAVTARRDLENFHTGGLSLREPL